MNNPDLRAFDEALAECIDALKNGAKVEECLSRYPHFSERLEPYLRIAIRVDEGLVRDQSYLPAATRASAMNRAQQILADRQQRSTAPALNPRRFSRAFAWVRSPRFALAAVALAILIVLGGVTVSVAQPSVPGEALYPVKRAAENVRLLFAFDSTARAELFLTYAERRSTEIHDLLARGLPVAPELLADLRHTLTSALAEMAFVDGETRNRLLERAIALTETQVNFLSTAAQNASQPQSSEFVHAAEAMQDLGDRAKEAQKDPKVLLSIEPSPTGTRADSVSSPTPGQSQEPQTPTVPPTRTPTPGGEPKPSATSPSPTREEETETPSRTPESSNSGGQTNTPRATQTPNPSNTPQPENTPQPTKTPDPSNLPQPTQTRQPTQTPNSGNTPQPTKTPDPTETPHG